MSFKMIKMLFLGVVLGKNSFREGDEGGFEVS